MYKKMKFKTTEPMNAAVYRMHIRILRVLYNLEDLRITGETKFICKSPRVLPYFDKPNCLLSTSFYQYCSFSLGKSQALTSLT